MKKITGKMWALVSNSEQELERLSMSGSLPDSFKSPWTSLSLDSDSEGCLEDILPNTILISSEGSPKGYGLKPEKVEIKEDEVFLRGRWQRILKEQKGNTLMSSLPLSVAPTWNTLQEVICVFYKKADLAAAVQSSLFLKNQSMTVASCEVSGEEDKILLLRILNPSTFLLERWSDLQVPMYRPGSPGIWVKLGFRHPWESSFQNFEEDHLAFISEDGWWSVPKTTFRNAFEFITLNLECVHQQWGEDRSLLKFDVPLQWGYRGTSPSPELWILTEEDVPRLENLFSILPHSELDNLQLACLEDHKGNAVFAIRESLTGRSRQYLDFGTGYCSFGGFPNLLTPVDYRIEPPVPRDLLGRLLEVTPGDLTLVSMVGTPSEKAPMEVLHISDRSFRGLNTLVEHIIRGGSNRLDPVLKKSSLDLGSLTTLPTRPPLAPLEPKKPQKEVRETSEEVFSQASKLPEEVVEVVEPKSKKVSRKKLKKKTAPRPVSDVELLEAELAAVQDLKGATVWAALAQLNFNRYFFEEGIRAYEHALWVASPEESPVIEEEFSAALTNLPKNASPSLALRHDIMNFSGQMEGESVPKFAGRVNTLVKSLRERESVLSKKSRWLLWAKLLEQTPDAVEAARVKESLLGELSRQGISEDDSFNFLRRHVRNSIEKPQFSAGMGAFLNNLQTVSQGLDNSEYRLESLGAVATAFEATGDVEHTSELLSEVSEGLTTFQKGTGASALALWGGCATRLSHPNATELFKQSVIHFSQMGVGLDTDRVLQDILEQIQHASLLGSESPLITQILDALTRQSPKRQCTQLCDCAELFVDLGAGPKILEQAKKLVELPEILSDSYYLENALKALVAAQSGRPPETQLSNRIVHEILKRDHVDESLVRTLDIVLSGCDLAALASLRPHIDRAEDPYQAMMLESSLIRGLSFAGEIEEGLTLLQDRLKKVWTLSKSPQKAQLLGRLLPNIPHFGRPHIGRELIKEVVESLKTSGLTVREQKDVLECAAKTSGQLGDTELCQTLLTQILDSFDSLVGAQNHGTSFLFEILGFLVDQVISLGRDEMGLSLIRRIVEGLTKRINSGIEADHPYFVHQARIKCAVALMSLEDIEPGIALLQQSASEITKVRIFDGRDRADLCMEGIQALSLTSLEDDSRLKLLTYLVGTGIGKENSGSLPDLFRRDLLRKTIREVVQRKSAYRLALIKIRTQEEQILRGRILRESLA